MHAVLVLGAAFTLGAPGLKDPPNKESTIVGEWVAEKVVQNGLLELEPGDLRHTFTAEGRWVVFRDGVELEGSNRGYVLDPKATPATIDFSLDRAKPSTAPLLGIFRLDGDILTLCVAMDGQPRPTEFSSPRRSQITLIVFKRMKKE